RLCTITTAPVSHHRLHRETVKLAPVETRGQTPPAIAPVPIPTPVRAVGPVVPPMGVGQAAGRGSSAARVSPEAVPAPAVEATRAAARTAEASRAAIRATRQAAMAGARPPAAVTAADR